MIISLHANVYLIKTKNYEDPRILYVKILKLILMCGDHLLSRSLEKVNWKFYKIKINYRMLWFC